MTFTFPTVPGPIPPPPPVPHMESWRHCLYPPGRLPSPPSFPPYVLNPPSAPDSNTNSNASSPTASPTPQSAESSPRWNYRPPIVVSAPKEPLSVRIRTPDSPPSRIYRTPMLLSSPMEPPPVIYSPVHGDTSAMSERELILLIEGRQRDIELTQLEISRKQSEINRAVADITSWLVELRHKRDGL